MFLEVQESLFVILCKLKIRVTPVGFHIFLN